MRSRALTQLASVSLLVGSSAILTGCGQRGTPTYPVTGVVLLDGQPVAQGDIAFFSTNPSLGPKAGKIQVGRFDFRAYAGTARVEIEAVRPLPGVPPGPFDIPATKRYIPNKYNRESTLEVEVLPQSNVFTFELKSGG